MRGFTLIETLIAIFVLILIITGPLSLAIESISISLVSQNQITAFYLGQEAIEYILNKRDTNFLITPRPDWLTGLDSCLGVNGCYVNVPPDTITPCGASCPKIKYDGTSGYYNYTTGTDTIFTRTVKITQINGDEARIDATVSWPEKFGGQKSLTLQRNIFNWIGN